ncbi:hypothetical protein J7E96_28420 [Streptomyces sp. ISL-96]|uniref:hypothetical protein n=1 Tax=Streptomyces sp. ISL-96 TaxID=2819191 RepID=UPI001BE93DC7|nr:hypothetical protein [Streptomyces sp. ISL-96]MBT2492366.1 hypothetical protein [Streptomyces sp. ISL-96]
MAATTATAQYAPAQVGNGRTAHKTDAEAFSADTLCERTVSRVLTAADAAKMKECVSCNRIAAERAAAPTGEPTEVETPATEDAPDEVEETEAPAAAEEAPEVDEVEPAAAEPVQVEEPAQVEGAPEVDDIEPAPAALVRVTAYTAAVEVLHANGTDSDDRVLTLDADALLETVAKMRRMPRWNAAEERFTVNKVAVIVARDAQGERVWVRGEAAPIRVDFTGTPIQEDAPAEAGAVDMAAVLAATRMLRRRKEVQRVIDNREAARAMSTPAPVEEPTPAPVVEESAPAPVVEESPAPVVEETEAPAVAPEWRTLKGMEAPFHLYGEEGADGFRPASDRKQCTGEPLTITRTWMAHGTRYAQDATGRECRLWGAATRYWVAPIA